MPRPPKLLPVQLGNSFSVRAARDADVSYRRLRHTDLATPFYGARMLAAKTGGESDAAHGPHDESPQAAEARHLTAEIVSLAYALAQVAPPDWFFCHVTAAVLWKLPVPLRLLRATLKTTHRDGRPVPPRGIDVGVIAPRRAPKAAGTRGREFSGRLTTVRVVDDLRVSSPASTWAMLAAELTLDELIELGDAIVRIPRRQGMVRGTESDALATIDELVRAANAPYRRHADKLAAALALIRVGSSSAAETRTRLAFSRAGLPEPELDYDVYAEDGTPIGFTEFAYPKFHLLVEYEGDHHRTDRKQWQRDIDKHAACFEAGWHVERLTAASVYPSTRPAVDRVRAALIRGGWHP